MAPVNHRFTAWGNWLSWLLVPLAVGMQLVWLRRPVTLAGVTVTAELVLFAGLAVVSSPWLWARRRELGRWGWILVGSFVCLVGYALATVLVHPSPVVMTSQEATAPVSYLVVPLVTAVAALLAGLGMALAAEPSLRPTVLCWAAVALVVAGVIAWPRQAAMHRSWRLATALGGSATIHVLFLLVAAAGLGWYLTRRTWPGLALGGSGLLALVATQSRGGLLMLVGWVLLLAGSRLIADRRDFWRLFPVMVLLGAAAVAVLLVPHLRQALSLADPLREQNLASALTWWGGGWQTMIFGAGSGQVWPWFLFDTGFVLAPGGRMIPTEAGPVLLSPHSTLLAVLVELGLVGALPGLVAVVALVRLAVLARRDAFAGPLAAALVASLVAFAFDTYLIKEFGNAFWWWLVAALVAARVQRQLPGDGAPCPRSKARATCSDNTR